MDVLVGNAIPTNATRTYGSLPCNAGEGQGGGIL